MQLGNQGYSPHRHQQTGHPVYNERRFTHTWVLGKSGTGKSTALVRWALDDIRAGAGVVFFDPHGDAAAELLRHIPPSRRADTLFYNPADRAFPIAFNILDRVRPDQRPFIASAVVDCFKSLWGTSWGPQLEQFLYNGTAALLDVPDGTLMGLKFLLTSPAYRARVLRSVEDPAIRDFWEHDFAEHMPERERRERTLSTLNKIGALIADPTIRNSIGQPRSAINFSAILGEQQILICSLAQGELGIAKSSLIGALLLAHLHLSALARTSRAPVHVYVDECHHFGTATLVEMLSGIRKFGVSLVLAHQYLDQLTPELRAALIGTVGTLVAFRLGPTDAEVLAPEFELTRDDAPLPQLRPFRAYARTERSWYLTMPEISAPVYPTSERKIINRARYRLATRREKIEAKHRRFIENT